MTVFRGFAHAWLADRIPDSALNGESASARPKPCALKLKASPAEVWQELGLFKEEHPVLLAGEELFKAGFIVEEEAL